MWLCFFSGRLKYLCSHWIASILHTLTINMLEFSFFIHCTPTTILISIYLWVSLCWWTWNRQREKLSKSRKIFSVCATSRPLFPSDCSQLFYQNYCLDCTKHCHWLFIAALSLLKLLVFYWVEAVKTLFPVFLGREIKPSSGSREALCSVFSCFFLI